MPVFFAVVQLFTAVLKTDFIVLFMKQVYVHCMYVCYVCDVKKRWENFFLNVKKRGKKLKTV